MTSHREIKAYGWRGCPRRHLKGTDLSFRIKKLTVWSNIINNTIILVWEKYKINYTHLTFEKVTVLIEIEFISRLQDETGILPKTKQQGKLPPKSCWYGWSGGCLSGSFEQSLLFSRLKSHPQCLFPSLAAILSNSNQHPGCKEQRALCGS